MPNRNVEMGNCIICRPDACFRHRETRMWSQCAQIAGQLNVIKRQCDHHYHPQHQPLCHDESFLASFDTAAEEDLYPGVEGQSSCSTDSQSSRSTSKNERGLHRRSSPTTEAQVTNRSIADTDANTGSKCMNVSCSAYEEGEESEEGEQDELEGAEDVSTKTNYVTMKKSPARRRKIDGPVEADLLALQGIAKAFHIILPAITHWDSSINAPAANSCTSTYTSSTVSANPSSNNKHKKKHLLMIKSRQSMVDRKPPSILSSDSEDEDDYGGCLQHNILARPGVFSPSQLHNEHISRAVCDGRLRVLALTWNMNGKKAALHDLARLAASLECEQYDLMVVGLQEVPSCDAETVLLSSFGSGRHSLVAAATMLSLQLFIIGRTALGAYLEDVRVDKVSGGGFGAVVRRQKGAVAVSFKFKDATFLFIASHLSPHESNVEERNSQFQRISQSLFCSSRPAAPSPRLSSCLNASTAVLADEDDCTSYQYRSSNSDHNSDINSPSRADSIVEGAHLVVWLGDLNYRIQYHRSLVDALIQQNLYTSLWDRDQLWREIQRGHVFQGFREGPLSFRPTYKYDVGTDNYDTSPKERVPSWTDRILYKVKKKKTTTATATRAAEEEEEEEEGHGHGHDEEREGEEYYLKVHVCGYDAIDFVKSSDHRPVKAIFTLSPW